MKTSRRTLAASGFSSLILLAATGLAHAGNGSSVAVAAEVAATSCPDGTAGSADIDVAVTAASAAPVTFQVAVGAIPFIDAGTSSNWTSHGRTKGMVETLVVTSPSIGTGLQVRICVAQPGSNGNDARSACTAVAVPVIQCNGGDGGDIPL